MRQNVCTKESIVDVAEQLIKDKGLDACTIRALAKEVNVAVGTLYNYFPSHKELLEEVFYQSWQKTIERLDIVTSLNISTADKVISFFNTIDEDIRSRNGIGRALFEQPFNPNDISSTRYRSFIQVRDLLVTLLKESNNNTNLTDDVVLMNSTWIIMGHIGLKHTDSSNKDFSKEVLKRFF